MADNTDRHAQNVGGRYYVDNTCIFCDFCTEIAPTLFAVTDDGYAYVKKQPQSEEELELADEALKGCPIESIGDTDRPGIEITPYTPESHTKRWWQFWKS